MKILRVLSVFLIPLVTAPALAGVTPGAVLAEPESRSVLAMRAMLTRCLPPMLEQRPPVTTGLVHAGTAVERQMLQDRPGSVWSDQDLSWLLIQYDDVPTCRVIALRIEPVVLGDLVLSVFRGDETPFRQRRFRIDEDGGFAALYQAGEDADAVIVRIWTAVATTGERFATLSVERGLPVSN